MTGIIYKYVNNLNGKCYIGQTIYEDRRRREHIRKASNNSNIPFYRALNKYGIDNFTYSVVVRNVPEALLNDLEITVIKTENAYTDGYNCTIGGDGQRGYRFDREVVEQIRKKNLGRTASKELSAYFSSTRKGFDNANSKVTNIYDYATGNIIAENVCMSIWCRDNGYDVSNLSKTARGVKVKYRGIYARYIPKSARMVRR